ncbi:MAG: hypothetical protein WCO58_02350 [bacterium]
MEKPTKIEDIASTIRMDKQLTDFEQKWNNGELPGQKSETAPTVSESVETPKTEKTFEESNADFWAEQHKEEEHREKVAKIKRDIENNMIVSVDGKSPNDNIFVSEKIITEEPKPKKKWWQF